MWNLPEVGQGKLGRGSWAEEGDEAAVCWDALGWDTLGWGTIGMGSEWDARCPHLRRFWIPRTNGESAFPRISKHQRLYCVAVSCGVVHSG